MTIDDYAVIGTADGLFAHGTGLLSEASAAYDLFQYRLPRDVEQFIPTSGATTIIRQPVVAQATRERFHLFVQLAAASDRARRPGFIGTAVLIPWEDLSQDLVQAVLERLDALLQQARDRYVDESGTFRKQPGPLRSSQRGHAPRLSAADDGSRSIFGVTEEDRTGPLVIRALHALSAIEAHARTAIQITTDTSINQTTLTQDAVTRFELQLAEEVRVRVREREEQRRIEEVAGLTDRIGSLEASVRRLEEIVSALRAEVRQSRPMGYTESYASQGAYFDEFDETHPSDYDGPHVEVGDTNHRRISSGWLWVLRDLGVGRLLLIGTALLGSILVVAALMLFLFGNRSLVLQEAPEVIPATEALVTEATTCEDALAAIEQSEIPGESRLAKVQELRSCVRSGFDGVSPLQADCSEPAFASAASALLGDNPSGETGLAAIDGVLERCEGLFE